MGRLGLAGLGAILLLIPVHTGNPVVGIECRGCLGSEYPSPEADEAEAARVLDEDG